MESLPYLHATPLILYRHTRIHTHSVPIQSIVQQGAPHARVRMCISMTGSPYWMLLDTSR